MTLRSRMLTLADKMRAIPARPTIDERPTTVTIRMIVWNSGRIGLEGTKTTTDLVMTPTPKVRWVNGQEVANSGGRYTTGDVKVGPITPAFAGGGYTEDQLSPSVTVNGRQVVYVLSGYINGTFDRLNLENAKSHSWFLILRARRPTR